MPNCLPPLRLTGAHVLTDGALIERAVGLADGMVMREPAAEVDFSGYWILPGIVDLHGDGFERHLAPRPSAPLEMGAGLASVDRDLAANGVTTAYLAQSWSWEGGHRGEDYAERLMCAVKTGRPDFFADIRLQVRYETHHIGADERLLAALRKFGVDYVVFNNHVPEALKLWEQSPERLARWAAENGRSAEEHMAIIRAAAERGDEVAESLTYLAECFDEMGVTFGSHDDPDEATRVLYHTLGARICEFPTTLEAAGAARDMGDPVLMGAPNVARGGSQSGNISAMRVIRRGLCDALVSDYHYPSLAAAAWRMADEGARSFADAWAMISSKPAEILDLTDRGELTQGLRADLVVMNPETRRIEATIAGGRLAYLAGEAGRRFVSAPMAVRYAAE